MFSGAGSIGLLFFFIVVFLGYTRLLSDEDIAFYSRRGRRWQPSTSHSNWLVVMLKKFVDSQ